MRREINWRKKKSVESLVRRSRLHQDGGKITTQGPRSVKLATEWRKGNKTRTKNKHAILLSLTFVRLPMTKQQRMSRSNQNQTVKCVWLFHESMSKRRLYGTSNLAHSPEGACLHSAARLWDYCVPLKGKCWECHTWECLLSTVKYRDTAGPSFPKNMSALFGLQQHLPLGPGL